ncbi:2-(1,2-epoxy-1,2-dihydrophenyl)acetyl-CoA isomerase [Desulfitispora alkaliphila]|uniref:enoyl-CoA hydratase/isomerase family protein n=1 Tax=Desulfitispora alkaliphila TaxID=622674 RepID=UPI003D2626CC
MSFVKLEELESGVAIIRLENPKALNAMGEEVCDGIIKAANTVKEKDNIRVVIITGSGPAFSAGGDISLLANVKRPSDAKKTFDHAFNVVKSIYELEKPVITAVNGVAAGAATSLVMASDLILANQKASMFFSFGQIGFCPDSACSYFLAEKVGYHKAAELIFFSRHLKAQECLDLGFFNKIVDDSENLMSTAIAWAEELAQGPYYSIKLNKGLLRQTKTNSFYDQAEAESLNQVLAWSSEDFREGAKAFLEKRKPNFKGK